MKKRNQTNLDVFMAMNQMLYPNQQPPNSIGEARREIYFLKVIDLIWFDGVLKNDSKGQQAFYLNVEWPTEPPPDGMPGISALDESALEWISKRMKRPVWADKNHLIKDFNLSDLFTRFHR